MFSSPFHAPLAAVVAYAIAVSAIPAVSATPGLAVKTSTPNVIVNGLKNLEVTATIANTGGEALKLLNDPSGILDPFPENSFAITDPSGSRLFGGARVDHNSMYAAGLNDPNDFTPLGPGGSTIVTHDLSPAYDDFAHSDTGDHPIEPSNSPAHVNGTPKHLYATVDGVAKVKLSGDLAVSRLVHAKRDDKFPGCTRREKGWIRAAGSVAHILITEAYEYVKHIPDVPAPENLPARYITWFGPYRFGRRLVVQGSLGLMSAEDQFTRLTYHCLRACRDKRWGAYVRPGNTLNMWICPPYWRADISYRAQAMIHEVSHYYSSEDKRYGIDGAMELAALSPDVAVINADNYMYFVDNPRLN